MPFAGMRRRLSSNVEVDHTTLAQDQLESLGSLDYATLPHLTREGSSPWIMHCQAGLRVLSFKRAFGGARSLRQMRSLPLPE